MSKNLYKT